MVYYLVFVTVFVLVRVYEVYYLVLVTVVTVSCAG